MKRESAATPQPTTDSNNGQLPLLKRTLSSNKTKKPKTVGERAAALSRGARPQARFQEQQDQKSPGKHLPSLVSAQQKSSLKLSSNASGDSGSSSPLSTGRAKSSLSFVDYGHRDDDNNALDRQSSVSRSASGLLKRSGAPGSVSPSGLTLFGETVREVDTAESAFSRRRQFDADLRLMNPQLASVGKIEVHHAHATVHDRTKEKQLPPLDFSHLEINSPRAVLKVAPRHGTFRPAPELIDPNSAGEGGATEQQQQNGNNAKTGKQQQPAKASADLFAGVQNQKASKAKREWEAERERAQAEQRRLRELHCFSEEQYQQNILDEARIMAGQQPLGRGDNSGGGGQSQKKETRDTVGVNSMWGVRHKPSSSSMSVDTQLIVIKQGDTSYAFEHKVRRRHEPVKTDGKRVASDNFFDTLFSELGDVDHETTTKIVDHAKDSRRYNPKFRCSGTHVKLNNNSLKGQLNVAKLCRSLNSLLLPTGDAVKANYFTCIDRSPLTGMNTTFLRFITVLDLSFNEIESIDLPASWARKALDPSGVLNAGSRRAATTSPTRKRGGGRKTLSDCFVSELDEVLNESLRLQHDAEFNRAHPVGQKVEQPDISDFVTVEDRIPSSRRSARSSSPASLVMSQNTSPVRTRSTTRTANTVDPSATGTTFSTIVAANGKLKKQNFDPTPEEARRHSSIQRRSNSGQGSMRSLRRKQSMSSTQALNASKMLLSEHGQELRAHQQDQQQAKSMAKKLTTGATSSLRRSKEEEIDIPYGNLHCLTSLYLHGNKLNSYLDVIRFAPLCHRSLVHLTWHGNEKIDVKKQEAMKAAVTAFPNLATLNFTTLTQKDL